MRASVKSTIYGTGLNVEEMRIEHKMVYGDLVAYAQEKI